MKEDKEFWDSLLQDYFAECDEHLLSIKRNILELEKYLGKEEIDQNIVNELFRSFHTIKGLSAMVGISEAEKISHDLESYLKLLKSGSKILTEEEFDLLREGVKVLEEILLAKKEKKEVPDIEEILGRLGKLSFAGVLSTGEGEKKGEVQHLTKIYKVVFYPSQDLSQKGINVEYIKGKLQEIGKIMEVTPKIDENKKMFFEFLVSCEQEEKLKEIAELGVKYFREEGKKEEKEIIEEKEIKPKPSSSQSYIRVDLKKLDEIMRIMGDLVIVKSRLQGEVKELEDFIPVVEYRNLTESLRILDKSLRELRESVMKVRLVPIGEAFERMQFVIKDLVRESNKKIELHISGKETEIDKYIVDRLIDPILHMVRNAVSHGIEPEEERIKKGKDPVGHIYLRAYTVGEEVYVEVENDGREMDKEKIAEKALKLGLIKDVSEVDSEEKILDIICSPNFSTRDDVDRASGRGVGMNVVKNVVNELGGSLYLRSDSKRGVCFTLKLPLTLAIIDTLVVEVGDEKFAIPQSSIKEIIEVKSEEIIDFRGASIVPYRNISLPLIFLSKVFNLKAEEKSKYNVLVVTREKDFGIVVDKVLSIKEAVVRPISDPLLLLNPAISGATDFGDGRVVLILNIEGLFKSEVRKDVISNR